MTKIEREIIRPVHLNKEVAIKLTNVGKKYVLHHERPTLVNNLGKMLKFQKTEEYWALQNVDLTIYKGEKIGIFGENGAGKTTLLKLIVGIAQPTTGKILTKGRIISLIDLEAGFHPDLTGQENIFLNGMIIGMSNAEIKSKFQQIVEFADIKNFITAPLYTYSSGMKLRLGFGIAIHADADILLLDEVINMGDEDFRKKSKVAIQNLLKTKTTILMISQFYEHLCEHCDTILRLRKYE